ncbi:MULTISPECIES: hypothetical protein [unclassified Marinitoga]|uniref:hypothetical protein n=1 Tax=unclassified Marinitoga TaxID=2640159 RepID=UPI000640EA8D|nr:MULTISPECIES: hypothetical protein [unclassified Marinitoga]KLO22944.1 hypothetical protein X274_07475 [Marinitoga sp. 1155]NUU99474.1 hypothetical protein [Marinitoga sp. 1154]
MRKSVLFLLIIFLFILNSCSSQPKTEPYEYFSSADNAFTEIVVEGKGINYEEAETNARIQALQNIVGMKLYNQTTVKNFKLVDKTILSKTYGFIKGSEILQKTSENGIYKIKIKYKVSKNLKDDDYFYILQQMKKPKIGVFIPMTRSNDFYIKIAETTIEGKLSKYGFNLFDLGKIRKVSDKINLANEGLDILIEGNIYAEYSGEYYGLSTARSKIGLKAYWTSTGKLVASVSAESGGSDVTKIGAIKTAVRKSSEIAGEKLSKEIIKTWMNYLANGLPVQIVILDISNEKYQKIYNLITSNFKVYSYNYSNNTAIFEIESKIFTDKLYNLYFKDYDLITQNMLYLVIK